MTELAKALIRAVAAMLEHGYLCNASAYQFGGGL
jgi:hypothetical protein